MKKKEILFSRKTDAARGAHPARMAAQLFLGFLCLAGGLAAPWISLTAGRLLNPAGPDADTGMLLPALYTPDVLVKTALVSIAGLLLFLLCSTKAGGVVLRLIRERPRNFQGLCLSLALGIAGMTAWLIYM